MELTTPVWMFLSRYEGFRTNTFMRHTVVNMLHCGRGIFGADFGTTTFVLYNNDIDNYKALYRKLFDKPSIVDSIEEKEEKFFCEKGLFYANKELYREIEGCPVAYWISENELKAFRDGKPLKDIATPRVGVITGNNDRFIKTWWEVAHSDISSDTKKYADSLNMSYKWYPYNKGGAARDWYGNRELVVFFRNGGEDIEKYGNETGAFYFLGAQDVFFREGVTWSGLTIGRNTFRFSPEGTLFDSNKGPMLFPDNRRLTFYLMGLFNTKVIQRFLSILNPTVSLQAGDFEKMPILFNKEDKVEKISAECVQMAKEEYDSYESSMDFKKHPLI